MHVRSAMILAAGLGTRMLPLTLNRPKPLLDLAGKPMLDYCLDLLLDLGVERIVVNGHHRAELIETWVQSKAQLHPDCDVIFSDERETLLDQAGGVIKALPVLSDELFWVINGDSVLYDPKGLGLASFLHDALAEGSARLALVDGEQALGISDCIADRQGDFCCDLETGQLFWPDQVEKHGIKMPCGYFCGYGLYHRDFFKGLSEAPGRLKPLWRQAMNEGRLFGRMINARFLHLGDPDALHQASQWLKNQRNL